ncbi:MAG: hypothetical protein Q7N50_08880 [Armatimonadota bacterium]|nr:hypothetical protein [Armatimonadota bacterium]
MRILISALLGIVLAAPVLAAGGDVSLAGRVIFRIRFPAGGYTVGQRADAAQNRLVTVLSLQEVTPNDVAVRIVNKETVVVVKDELVITADWPTARFNKTTPDKLAAIWAENLRQALSISIPRPPHAR